MNRVEGNGYVMNFKSNGMSGSVLQNFTRVTNSDLQRKTVLNPVVWTTKTVLLKMQLTSFHPSAGVVSPAPARLSEQSAAFWIVFLK